MTEIAQEQLDRGSSIRWLPLIGAFIALIGVADSVYLTVQHYTAVPVPCTIIEGCETVLTSPYATFVGIPIAAFGAAAYFVAFSLAVLAAFGDRRMWTLFGIVVGLMALFTGWLIYLQAFVIGAFCQFCLLSAATTFALLVIFAAAWLRGRRIERV